MASHNPDQTSPNRGTFIQGMFHMNREFIEVALMSADLTGADLEDAMNSRLGDVEHIIPEAVRDLITAQLPTLQQEYEKLDRTQLIELLLRYNENMIEEDEDFMRFCIREVVA